MRRTHIFWGIVGIGLFISQASGYALLNFPTDAAVQADSYYRWSMTTDPLKYHPGIWSYSIQSSFLGGSANAKTAVVNALAKWDEISEAVSFAPAGYEPVLNTRDNWIAGGYKWEGAGAAVGSTGIGANIDIFSYPSGFSFTDIRGQTRTVPSTSLGVTFYTTMNNSTNLLSVDIILNSSYNWSTTGGNFDIETVILHELGHALGLDHPDQAVANGAANYDPHTHQPGATYTRNEVMDSGYFPDGINRTLGEDEIGGLAFLYPVQGDTDTNGQFTFADVQLGIDMFFGFASEPNPVALQNADLNHNGELDFQDVDSLITLYFFPNQAAPQNYTLTLLGDMGYDTTNMTLPEPSSVALILTGIAAWRRPKRKLQ